MNPPNIKAQSQKIAEYEVKRTKMLKEYNDCINLRADELLITKISYKVICSSNDATMKITRGNDPLNVVVHNKFRLKTLGFTKKLGVPPLPELSTFGISVDDRKRKRSSEILQEVFVKENIVVDGMHINIAPPPGVEGRRDMVIRKPEAGIFYYNGNFDLVFQRESEFYLATTVQMVRLHNDIIRGTLEALIELEIKSRNDVTKAREIVKDNLDGMGQHIEQPQTYSSQRHHQGIRRSLEDILVSWDGYQLAGNSITHKGGTKALSIVLLWTLCLLWLMDCLREGTAKAFYASADMPVQSDPLGPLHEELRILNTKIDKLKSSIAKKVTDDVQSSSLQNELSKILRKPMNKESNALNTLESRRFVMLQKELSKVIRTKIGKSVKAKVPKGMSFISDRVASVQSSIATNSHHVFDLCQAFQDMNFLLESVEVFKKANKGEKSEKNNLESPAQEENA
ncbi:hypothetical protein Tco_0637853 [Tanacetum coccineum]